MMKVEISCPACQKAYLVEEHSLGGQFVCPGCTTPIILQLAAVVAPKPVSVPPPAPVAQATRPVPSPPDAARTDPAIHAGPPATPAPASEATRRTLARPP